MTGADDFSTLTAAKANGSTSTTVHPSINTIPSTITARPSKIGD